LELNQDAFKRVLCESGDHSAERLEKVYQVVQGCDWWLDEALLLASLSEASLSATSLLKRHIDLGGSLDTVQQKRFVLIGLASNQWQARMHILQSLDQMCIEPEHYPTVCQFAFASKEDPNKFIRAWSCSVVCRLAVLDEKYQPFASAALALAEADEAASVRARVRQLRKKTPSVFE